jgi:alkylhydroperoxidase family enzyme
VSAGSPRSTDEVFAAVLDRHPGVLASLDAAHRAAWAAVDGDLLELCRLRIAMLLGNEEERSSDRLDATLVEALPSWPTSELFTPAQRACLALTEQFVIDVAGVDDAQVAAVADELGGDGLSSFVNALLVVEQRQRLRLAWSRLFPEVP